MELVPSDVDLSFEVTFDRPDLSVGMSVFDDTGSTPTLVFGPVLMAHVVANTYRAKFTPQDSHSYIIVKAVYTDPTLSVMNPDYSQGSESILAQDVGGGSSSSGGVQSVIGYVSNPTNVIGFVSC